ncbi:hypothetical protein [Leptospira weilii]|nr:hypothetical protein [Leptospira weilii]
MINEMQNDLEHLIERMYQFYNQGNDDRTYFKKFEFSLPSFDPNLKLYW